MTTRTLQNLINGESVDSSDGRTSTLINPSTEEEFAQAAVSGSEDVDRAMNAAAKAFETWRDSTPSERQRALLKLADAMEDAHRRVRAGREREHRQAARLHQDRGAAAGHRPGAVLRRCRAGARGQARQGSTWRATRRTCAASRSASSPR